MKFAEYRDKVLGCWYGKSIGGTLGAPFECYKGVVDLDYYIQDMSEGSMPNDDLDLQLVWLTAAETYGKTINAHILAEYWLAYIYPNWSEYGAAKNNLSMGIMPPFSGRYHNHNRNSNGSFIRAELWACLNPGHPDRATRYAYEDAMVDHADEGMWAELFCAAILSAAFSESNFERLLNIGLSYIPADCAVAGAVHLARSCKADGLGWKEARRRILRAYPSSFGGYNGLHPLCQEEDREVPVGELGDDAPASIGIIAMSLLLGEGDFGRSICMAAGCCEDGDCTAGTLAALLGILSGASGLPERWVKPIGNVIKTMCVDTTTFLPLPHTLEELTARVCNLMPTFMGDTCSVLDGTVSLKEGESLLCGTACTDSAAEFRRREGLLQVNSPILKAELAFLDGLHIRGTEPIAFHLHVKNRLRCQQWLVCRWILPAGWKASAGEAFCLNLDQDHGGYGKVEADFSLIPGELTQPYYVCVLEIASQGRPTRVYLPVTLVVNPQSLVR